MKTRILFAAAVLLAAVAATVVLLQRSRPGSELPPQSAPPAAALPESHLAGIRQLTFAGENAEAYFSLDDQWLIFQGHENAGAEGSAEGSDDACDQIYVMDTTGGNRRLVSTGRGRTTCAYFFPSGGRILYSSTHLASPACPPKPDYSRGYVWPLDDYDIFAVESDGSDLRRLTTAPGYDAEATISRDGRKIVFTSVRDGDLEIYTMDAGGGNVRRLTHEAGYDGGAFFSFDGSQIVYRAHHPSDAKQIEDFRALLRDGLVRPTTLEIFVMNADGSNQRQITSNGAANFAPFFHPDGKRILFSSNMGDPQGREFDIYVINTDGTGLERITYSAGFDGFPMFSSDGKRLVFASNRNAAKVGDTNIFIADWVD